MFRLWKRWIAYPLGWLAIMGIVLAALSFFAGRGETYSDMESFHGRYEAKDLGGELRLHVTETIVVNLDRERGIIRDLISDYGDHDTGMHTFAVTNEDGEPYPFRTTPNPSGVELRIGDPNEYLDGKYTFVITYQVDRAVVATDDYQELYLNTNGTEWPNGFKDVSAEIVVDDSLASKLTGEAACYQGKGGSTDRCQVSRSGNTFSAEVGRLGPWENMTLAVGFQPGSFPNTVPPFGAASLGWWGIGGMLAIGLAAVGLSLAVRALVRDTDRGESGIVTQFTPPEDLEPVLAADFLGVPERGGAAHLAWLVAEGHGEVKSNLDAAAPGPEGASLSRSERRQQGENLTLKWDNPHGSNGRGPMSTPMVKITEMLFGSSMKPVSLLRTRYPSDLAEAQSYRDGRLARLGLRKTMDVGGYVLWIGYLALIALGVYQIWRGLAGLGWFFLAAGVVSILLLIYAAHRFPVHGRLTEKGREVSRYLAGLERFIKGSEQQRISWMNNVASAPRDGEQRVQLYEKLLPWAIVFGAENSWQQVLGDMYSRFPEQRPLSSWVTVSKPAFWANDDADYYRSSDHRDRGTFWGERPSFGEGAISKGLQGVGQVMSDIAAGRGDDDSSTRSSGRGWGGGSSSSWGGGGGSSGGGRSGGGTGGGGGGRW